MTHRQKVLQIARQLKNRSAHSGHLSLQKEAVSHFVPNPKDPRHQDKKINIRDLKEILEIKPKARTCTAEPGVTFVDLVTQTLKHGLIPKLVPELKTITIGGAVSGCSVESMSYKYGGFHDSCLEYEVITAKGEILTCTRQKNADIFQMIHGSYGTLGILSKLKFELIPGKPYVKMTYIHFKDFESFYKELLKHCKDDDFDFVDAIAHSPNHFVLCLGTMVDRAPYTSDYTWLDIFYKSTAVKKEDYLTTLDYFFRYDTECHWLSRTIPGMENKLMRLLFGKFLLSSTNLLTWSKRLAPVLKYDQKPDVVVDLFIPSQRMKNFYEFYLDQVNYFPLWIIPYRRIQEYPWIDPKYAKKIGSDLFIDVAIYGLNNRKKGVDYYRLFEEEVYELKGIKTLISHNSYTRERFWEIYNRANYEKIKQRVDPENLFRNLYEKFNF